MISRVDTKLELLGHVISFGRPCTPEEFGRKAYGDSPAWDDLPKRRRRGVKPGGRMRSAAAGVLGQLRSENLVQITADGIAYYATDVGLKFMERHGRLGQRGAGHTVPVQGGTRFAQQSAPATTAPYAQAQHAARAPYSASPQPPPLPQWGKPQWVELPYGRVWWDGQGCWWIPNPDGTWRRVA